MVFDETLSKLGGTLHPLTVDEKPVLGQWFWASLLLWILWTGIEGTPSSQDLSTNPSGLRFQWEFVGGRPIWMVRWNLRNCLEPGQLWAYRFTEEHGAQQIWDPWHRIIEYSLLVLCESKPCRTVRPRRGFHGYINSLFQVNKWLFLEKWGALQKVILSMVLKQSDTCHAVFGWSRFSHILSGLCVFIIKVEESPVGWNSDAPKLSCCMNSHMFISLG